MANILVTGGTGFLGQQFVRKLFEKTDDTIFLLVRPKNGLLQKRSEFEQLNSDRIQILAGDITDPQVSFDIAPRFSEIWHLAGSTDFQDSRKKQTLLANVTGVKNIVSFAQRNKVDRFFHVSTAYVSGIHPGKVYEDELIENPCFRNVYEEAKYKGEKIVRCSGLDYIILRPSIIMGHSKTGEVESDKMVYGVAKLYSKFDKGIRKYFNGSFPNDVHYFVKARPETTKNLIAVDDVIALMLNARNEGKVKKTYHLCNPKTTTIESLHRNLSKVIGIDYISVSPEFNVIEELGQAHIDRGVGLYEHYLMEHDSLFDLTNAKQITNGLGIKQFDDSLQQFLYKKYLEQRCFQ